MSKVEPIAAVPHVARSICETGAQDGEYVMCVASESPSYTPGKAYRVAWHFGRAHVLTGELQKPTPSEARRGMAPYPIPVEGYGATWRRVVK